MESKNSNSESASSDSEVIVPPSSISPGHSSVSSNSDFFSKNDFVENVGEEPVDFNNTEEEDEELSKLSQSSLESDEIAHRFHVKKEPIQDHESESDEINDNDDCDGINYINEDDTNDSSASSTVVNTASPVQSVSSIDDNPHHNLNELGRKCGSDPCDCDSGTDEEWDNTESSEISDEDVHFADTESSVPSESQNYRYDSTESEDFNQLCTFCCRKFANENDLSSHLNTCNPAIKKIVLEKSRQCLICKCKMPQFSLCGLLRHANICLINDREKFVRLPNQISNPTDKIQQDSEDSSESENNLEDEDEDFSDIPENNQPSCQFRPRHNTRQITVLTDFFNIETHPTKEEKEFLADETGLSTVQITNWFQSRRKLFHPISIDQTRRKSKKSPTFKTVKMDTKTCGSMYTVNQYEILEACLKANSNPDLQSRKSISQKTKLTLKQVTDWFYRKRKSRKEKSGRLKHRKAQEQPNTTRYLRPTQSSQSSYPEVRNTGSLNILRNKFKTDNCPSLNDLFDLEKATGWHIRNIKKWFENQRRARRTRRFNSSETKRHTVTNQEKSKSKYLNIDNEDADQSTEMDEVETSSVPKYRVWESHQEFKKVEVQLKDMPIRKKFATLKKIKMDDFNIVISTCEPLINKLVSLFNEKCERQPLLKILIRETELLASIFKLNNPFSSIQIDSMKEWESEMFRSILNLQSSWKWTNQINCFGLQVLEVWVPTLVYSKILKVPVEKAVKELYHLSLARTDTSQLEDWIVPKLLEDIHA